MKEYIIATLASLCFTNSVEIEKTYSSLEAQPEKSEIQQNSKYKKLNSSFNFQLFLKQKEIIYNTAPTKWIKVK